MLSIELICSYQGISDIEPIKFELKGMMIKLP